VPKTKRPDGRLADQLRPLSIETDVIKFPPGSVLVAAGDTRLLCTVTLVKGAPDFLAGTGSGWLTAQYAMLPASTPTRKPRQSTRGKPDGRAQEIQRIIGRALRTAVNLDRLGENTLYIDCDVIQADGGTRTLAVTGAWVALALAARRLRKEGILTKNPIHTQIAAVSVGLVAGKCLLDLNYREDAAAEVDMNVVMTKSGRFVEIQGTAETQPFDKAQLDRMLDLARKGCLQLMRAQHSALRAGRTP